MDDPHGLWILGLSVAALLVGPGIHRVARREPLTMAALDNFVLVVVVGLVALEIVPGALELAGMPAFAALLVGALGPALADGPLHRASRGTHSAALALAIVGMAFHSFTDGVALASAHAAGGHSHALEAAVIAHQLPVAVAVWWLLSPVGLARAAAAMLALGLATIAGFLLADHSLAALAPTWLGLLQALFAGFLLHVIAHRSGPTHERPLAPRRFRLAAAVGGLAGITLLVVLALDAGHGHGHDLEPRARLLADLERLVRHAAPPLVAALALAVLALPLRRRLAHDLGPATTLPPSAKDLSERSGSLTRLRRRPTLTLREQVDQSAPWLLATLLLVALIQPWLPASGLSQIPPALQVPLLALLGVPFHVFAPAATPLVAVLVAAGVGPGAALACILSGPATELGVHRREQGRKLGRTLMASMLVFLICLGLLIDLRMPMPTVSLPPLVIDLAVLALAALLLADLLRQTPQQFFRRLWQPGGRVDAPHDHGHHHHHGEHAEHREHREHGDHGDHGDHPGSSRA